MPQQGREFAEKGQPLVSVIRLPHCRLQPPDLVRLKIAEAVGAGSEKVPRGPGENGAHRAGGE